MPTPAAETCECVGLPPDLLENETARKGYPATYGDSCASHDLTTAACSGDIKPAWCYESWCYVNPSCAVSDKKGSFFFPGHELYYSYQQCGALDAFAASACGEHHDAESCTAFSSNCVFNAITGACQNKLCQCTGDNMLTGENLKKYGESYGEMCKNWDQDSCTNWETEGAGFDLGLWCCKDWCYVDPSCPSAEASELHEALAYSYLACPDDAQDLLQCPWKDAIDFGGDPLKLSTEEAELLSGGGTEPQPAVHPPMEEEESMSMPVTPAAETCECVGLPPDLLENETARKGYPATYGDSCASHDLTTAACSGDIKPAWCYESWCYVNPSCAVSDKKGSFFFPGHELYYSYQQCGALDAFAASACGEHHDAESCTSFSTNCVFNEVAGACQNKLCQCTG